MNISILIPHFRNGKITAHAISKLLEYKGKHDIEILVIDNDGEHDSKKYLSPFKKDIKYQAYPKDRIQSHGVAFDFILPYVKTDYFITIESDSFPTDDKWLDYIEDLINQGYDSGGSVLQLSGGTYQHPCGAFYSKKVWQEAKQYCNNVQFAYFPNMSVYGGFDCHVMLHRDIVEKVLNSPYDYIELSEGYKGLSRQGFLEKMMYYSPVVAPFHNGMGMNNESLKTYGQRNIESETPNILLMDKPKIVNRIGYEPGQWITYWMLAMNKKVFSIPTETKWLPKRENQQQEYTKMENGFIHIWAGSSYLDMKDGDYQDVYEFKSKQIEELYNSLPNNQKIKTWEQ